MKKIILVLLILFSINCIAQDNTDAPKTWKFNHEIGVNTTLLLKQVFNLSNNTFSTLPYNLTYKLIHKKWAIRLGTGISLINSKVKTSTTSTGTNAPPPGPDAEIPTENKSTDFFYRLGWEYQFDLGKGIIAYSGLDFAGQYGESYSQNSLLFNNLPNSYSFIKTTNDLKTNVYGGGIVAGIQIYLTKHLSLFTEIPVYFQWTEQKEETVSYRNSLDFFNGNYESEEEKQTDDSKVSRLSITLPVTLYLALKF